MTESYIAVSNNICSTQQDSGDMQHEVAGPLLGSCSSLSFCGSPFDRWLQTLQSSANHTRLCSTEVESFISVQTSSTTSLLRDIFTVFKYVQYDLFVVLSRFLAAAELASCNPLLTTCHMTTPLECLASIWLRQVCAMIKQARSVQSGLKNRQGRSIHARRAESRTDM